MQILFKMTITSSAGSISEGAVDIEKLIDWPPDMRIPVKDDVVDFGDAINLGGMTRAVEEVRLHPLGIGPFATVWVENFIDSDPEECANIDFPDWTKT